MLASLSKVSFLQQNCKPQGQICLAEMINVSPRVLFASSFLASLRWTSKSCWLNKVLWQSCLFFSPKDPTGPSFSYYQQYLSQLTAGILKSWICLCLYDRRLQLYRSSVTSYMASPSNSFTHSIPIHNFETMRSFEHKL